MDKLELQTYPISRKKILSSTLCPFVNFFIKFLIKHPSKYKIIRSKTVEEVSRTDERLDIMPLDFSSRGIIKKEAK